MSVHPEAVPSFSAVSYGFLAGCFKEVVYFDAGWSNEEARDNAASLVLSCISYNA